MIVLIAEAAERRERHAREDDHAAGRGQLAGRVAESAHDDVGDGAKNDRGDSDDAENRSPLGRPEALEDLAIGHADRARHVGGLGILADAPDPWPFLLRVARAETRASAIRRNALLWLSTGVTVKLGIADAGDDTDEDEIRKQVVFALSQRPKSESVPELIDLARTSKYPSARRSAIFWLGQTGDPRAADVYAELLDIR